MQLFLTLFVLLIYDGRNCIGEFIEASVEEKVPRRELISPKCRSSTFL